MARCPENGLAATAGQVASHARRGDERPPVSGLQGPGCRGWRTSTRAPHTAGDGHREAPCVRPYLADVLEVLDVHALGVHDLLDDIGPHLLLALGVPVAVHAGVPLLLPARGAAGPLRQLFLIDSQLQPTQRGRVTWGMGVEGLPGFHFPTTGQGGGLALVRLMCLAGYAVPAAQTPAAVPTTSLLQSKVFLRPSRISTRFE